MAKHTESENKVSKILGQILSVSIGREPHLRPLLESISLTPYIFTEDLPKIMVLTLPLELLINLKLQYGEIIGSLRREFPKYIILIRRAGEIPPSKVFTPIKSREELIGDLVFPAMVTGRSNEVESREEMTQLVYLESKNQCWSKPELAAIERLLCTVFEQNFRVRIFGSGF